MSRTRLAQEILPLDCWELVLSFVLPGHEFFLALVCKDWYSLLQKRMYENKRTTLYAGAVCNLSRFVWSMENGMKLSEEVAEAATSCGNLEVLQMCVHIWKFIPLKRKCAFNAARAGSIEMIEWLRDNSHLEKWTADNWEACFEGAACSGNIPLLDLLLTKIGDMEPTSSQISGWAAALGHVHVLDWLKSHGMYDRCNTLVFWRAIRDNQLGVLEWVRKNYPRHSDSYACQCAAMNGRFEILKWLRAHNYRWDGSTIAYAKTPEIKQWVIDNGCPVHW